MLHKKHKPDKTATYITTCSKRIHYFFSLVASLFSKFKMLTFFWGSNETIIENSGNTFFLSFILRQLCCFALNEIYLFLHRRKNEKKLYCISSKRFELIFTHSWGRHACMYSCLVIIWKAMDVICNNVTWWSLHTKKSNSSSSENRKDMWGWSSK